MKKQVPRRYEQPSSVVRSVRGSTLNSGVEIELATDEHFNSVEVDDADPMPLASYRLQVAMLQYVVVYQLPASHRLLLSRRIKYLNLQREKPTLRGRPCMKRFLCQHF
jgi:hypothetical protein